MIQMIERLTGISQEAIHPVMGLAGAIASTATLWIANTVEGISPEAQGWAQLGGTIGLITFLIYACRTLWNALQDSRTAAAALEKEIRTEWKQQNEALMSVLRKLDPDA